MGQFHGACHKQMHNDEIRGSQAGRDQPPEHGTIAVYSSAAEGALNQELLNIGG